MSNMLIGQKGIISVILPIYNGSRYINRCIESVLNNTWRELELICVDDGSTDNSRDIVKSYINKDDRVKLLTKENGGVIEARKLGIGHAKGEYITFIDQDDWVEINTYEKVIKQIEQDNSQLCVFGYCRDKNGHSDKMINENKIPTIISSADDAIRFGFAREQYRNFAIFLWNRVFKTEFLKELDVEFWEKQRIGDDLLTWCVCAMQHPRISYLEDNFYHWVLRDESVSHTKSEKNIKVLNDIILSYEKCITLLENSSDIKASTVNYLKTFYVYHASCLYEIASENNMGEWIEIYKNDMKKYFKEYCKQNASKPERIEQIAKMIGVN